jgi:hypothetical protein
MGEGLTARSLPSMGEGRGGDDAVNKFFLSGSGIIRRDDWLRHLEGFRHALAHRIPLYVIPYTLHPDKLEAHNDLEERKQKAYIRRDFLTYDELDAEQEELGKFSPYITHSISEGAPFVPFHVQILADWNTIVEMTDEFRKEINPS